MRRRPAWRLAAVALAVSLPACMEGAPIVGAMCADAHPCPNGHVCVGSRCEKLQGEPVSACTADGDCSIGVCLKSHGFCVQCTNDSHCAFGVCLPQRQCGCLRAEDCTTGRCYIQPGREAGYCASCYADSQCLGGHCNADTGICEKPDGPDAGPEGTDR